jgi:hypothetical protein
VAYQYYAATLGYPFSVGGVFWWYFVEEMAADPALQDRVRRVVQALEGELQLPPPSPSVPGNLKTTAP